MEDHSAKLRKSDWEVTGVPFSIAQDLIRSLHYAKGGSNTYTYLHGMYPKLWKSYSECVGVAWWIPPTKGAAISMYPEGDWRRVLSLSRLAIEEGVPSNSESYLIGASIRQIKRDGRWDCLITYADEWQGHLGTIYKATNWEYMGLTKPERCYQDSSGRMVSRKAGPRTRTHAQMLELGCVCIGSFSKHRYRMVLR